MFLARVKGHIVATAKDRGIHGQRLLIVEPLKVVYDDPASSGGPTGGGTFEVTGRAIVAVDPVGAGEGELVLICQGSSARQAEGMSKTPVDAIILGIVDDAVVMGKKVT